MRAPARPRSCFAFSLIATVTALGLLIFAGVAGAEVKPGEMVGADNAEQVKDLVSPGTPLPTPWQKEAFDNYSREYQKKRTQIRKENRPEEEMEALFREDREKEDQMFAAEKFLGKVGAFEGAMYESTGYFRPEIDCIMFTRSAAFCTVCRRAIERVIDFYSH